MGRRQLGHGGQINRITTRLARFATRHNGAILNPRLHGIPERDQISAHPRSRTMSAICLTSPKGTVKTARRSTLSCCWRPSLRLVLQRPQCLVWFPLASVNAVAPRIHPPDHNSRPVPIFRIYPLYHQIPTVLRRSDLNRRAKARPQGEDPFCHGSS